METEPVTESLTSIEQHIRRARDAITRAADAAGRIERPQSVAIYLLKQLEICEMSLGEVIQHIEDERIDPAPAIDAGNGPP